MRSDWKITFFKPNVPGVFTIENGIKFAAEFSGNEECGIILYEPGGTKTKIPFSTEGKRGTLYGIQVEGRGIQKCQYHYYKGTEIVTDLYAAAVCGLEKWGEKNKLPRRISGALCKEAFDWENDVPLEIPYEDTLIYGLNVRAFTMHKSSGVKHKGTFEGIVEKIPYLKELGISAIELMPCYEYEECMSAVFETAFNGQIASRPEALNETLRLNCWGFQMGYYFAPKASYSAGNSPAYSFKSMVKALHQNGIEVMMHFYFPPQIKQLYMLEVIKYWVSEYHIDGVRISGFHIPVYLLSEDATLQNTKIWMEHLNEEEIQVAAAAGFRNFAVDNYNFKNDMRRFLKGDEGLMSEVLKLHRKNPKETAVINYLADYDGFSLYDCVSYERKHNEANGEENRDGTDLNYTWNCGVEGDTRKKAVQELRMKQLKNALAILFLSQGTPFLFSGDEFANTRFGNNNAYCQDNDTGWIKWKENQFSKELLSYTKFLISLRKANRIFHMKETLKVMDQKGCGYPDISYHGIEAWRPDLSYISRMAGIMLCGQYVDEKAASFYIAFNMHWEPHKFALPKLPKGSAWKWILDTSMPLQEETAVSDKNCKTDALIEIGGRSIAIYQSVPYTLPKQSKIKKKIISEKENEHEGLETF